MVIVIFTGWIPHDQAEKAGKLYLETMKKFPRDKNLSKSLLDGAIMPRKEGYKYVSVGEIKEGKLAEALDLNNKRALSIAKELEGYKYKMEVYSSLFEALGVVGLKPPE